MIRRQKIIATRLRHIAQGCRLRLPWGTTNEIERILKGFRHGGAIDGTLSGFRFTIHSQPRVAEDGNPGLDDTTPLALIPVAECPRILQCYLMNWGTKHVDEAV